MAPLSGLPDLEELGREIFGRVPAAALVSRDRRLEVADPDEPLFAAVSRMWWRRVGALPVVGPPSAAAAAARGARDRESRRLLGCVAEDDLVRLVGRLLLDRAATREPGGPLPVWDDLLAGLRVRDAMVPAKDLPVVSPDAPLLEALDRACERAAPGPRCRYVLVAEGPEGAGHGEGAAVAGVISFRDVARLVTSLYEVEGPPPGAAFGPPARFAALQRDLRRVLDRFVGRLIEGTGLGHRPVRIPLEVDAAAGLEAIHRGGRGYGLACLPDGEPLAICTRRDAIRALADPFADLRRIRMPSLVSWDVKTLFPNGTLFGLFRRMALENCRHMPVTDEWGRVGRVVSLWEAIWLLAHGSAPAETGGGGIANPASSQSPPRVISQKARRPDGL